MNLSSKFLTTSLVFGLLLGFGPSALPGGGRDALKAQFLADARGYVPPYYQEPVAQEFEPFKCGHCSEGASTGCTCALLNPPPPPSPCHVWCYCENAVFQTRAGLLGMALSQASEIISAIAELPDEERRALQQGGVNEDGNPVVLFGPPDVFFRPELAFLQDRTLSEFQVLQQALILELRILEKQLKAEGGDLMGLLDDGSLLVTKFLEAPESFEVAKAMTAYAFFARQMIQYLLGDYEEKLRQLEVSEDEFVAVIGEATEELFEEFLAAIEAEKRGRAERPKGCERSPDPKKPRVAKDDGVPA